VSTILLACADIPTGDQLLIDERLYVSRVEFSSVFCCYLPPPKTSQVDLFPTFGDFFGDIPTGRPVVLVIIPPVQIVPRFETSTNSCEALDLF